MIEQHTPELSLKQLSIVIVFAMLTRFAIPPLSIHAPNLTAVNASALFCGAYFIQRRYGIVMVLLGISISDLFLNRSMLGIWSFFYPGWYWQYASYALIYLTGCFIKHKSQPLPIFYASVTASLLFFIISNFGVWLTNHLYPLHLAGLIACYTAALPFFKYTLCSDLLFTAVLFGLVPLTNYKIISNNILKVTK